MICEGELDDIPEMAFCNVGTIDDALAKAKALRGEEEDEEHHQGPVDKSKVGVR